MEESGTGFRKELVSKLLHLHFKDDKTKVSGDALQLTAELLKVFVVEAAVRSVRQAQAEDLTRVDVDQLEKVLPQLVGAPPGAGPGPGAVGAGLAAPTGSEHAPRPPTAPGLLRLSTSPWLPACVTAKPRVHVSCGFYFQKGQELLPPGSPPLRRQASVPAKRPSPCHALPGCGRWGTEWEPGPWGLAPGWCPPLCTPRSSRAPTGWQEHTQEEWASCQPSERPPHTSRVMGRCHQRPSWAVTFQPLDTPQKMLP
uniref:Centromere protein X n=1 Tax=Sus scrofa TaxID=9823 RepID=A0A8D2BV19_PIG